MAVYCQDLSNIRHQQPITLNGNVGLASNFTHISNNTPIKSQFNNNIQCNLNLNIFNVSLPFSGTYTFKSGFTYNQPFKMYGLSPQYKWVKLNIGHRNMQLTKLSLSGITFFGAGIELNPKWFRFSAMYGNLKPITIKDTKQANFNSTNLKVNRIGWGGKVGIGNSKNYVDLAIFKAEDIIKTPLDSIEKTTVKPAENLVAGLSTKLRLLRHITITSELDVSAFTENKFVQEVPSTLLKDVPAPALKLFKPRLNSIANYATQSNVSFNFGTINSNISYKMVMPEYRSLGNNFKGGDQEVINALVNFALLQHKINCTLMGSQAHNNLDLKKSSTNYYTMALIQSFLNINEHFNVNLSYNWMKLNNVALAGKTLEPNLKLDNIKHIVLVAPTYNFETKKANSNLAVQLNYAIDENKNLLLNNPPRSTTGNITIGFSTQNKKNKSINTFGIFSNQQQANQNKSAQYGFNYGNGYSIFKNKLNTQFSYQCSINEFTAQFNELLNAVRINLNCNINKHQSFFISSQANYAFNIKNRLNNRVDYNMAIGYNYKF
jgi:hypothetical protein